VKTYPQQLSSAGSGLAAPPPPPSPKVQKGSDEGFVRAIGLNSAVLMVLGAAVGSGIFLTTGVMATYLPSVTLLLTAWVAGGLLVLTGGLTYAEMGSMYPRSGGLYVFLSEAYGPLTGFLFGWASLLVVITGSVAAVAIGFAEYFSFFFPTLSMQNEIARITVPGGALSIKAGQLVGAVSIIILGIINYVGVRSGNALQATLTILKITALVGLLVLAFAVQRVEPVFTPVIPPEVPRTAAAFGVAMVAVMWTYEGWYYVAFASGEIKNPSQTLPRALIIGTFGLMLIYVVINAAYFYSLSISEMQGVERIAEKAVSELAGAGAGSLVASTVAVSTFGCNAAAVIGMSRICYAMAADGMFFRVASRVHPVYRTPHVAILITCGWSALLTLTGTYEQLFTYVTFASVLFFVAGGLAIFKLRWSKPDVPRPYRTWGYPVVPAIFVIGCGALVYNTLIERPTESIVGLGLVLLGIPFYWYWRKESEQCR